MWGYSIGMHTPVAKVGPGGKEDKTPLYEKEEGPNVPLWKNLKRGQL